MKKNNIFKQMFRLLLCLGMISVVFNSCGDENFWIDNWGYTSSVKVRSITINPSGDVAVGIGRTTTLTASIMPDNAANKGVTWSSLNTNVATVNSQTGVVTGVSAGTATIRAMTTDGSGITANKSVTVTQSDVKVTSITIHPTGNVGIEIDKTTTLTASIMPDNATNKDIIWSSLNTSVATVDAQTGVVTGVSAGTATIRATAADGSGVSVEKSVAVLLTVVKITNITISPIESMSVEVGKTTTFTTTVMPDSATNKNVTWSSLNTNVATVDSQTGIATGVSAGTASIRATAADDSGISADKTITVIQPDVKVTSITINPSGSMSVEVGKTTTLAANVMPTDATNKNVTWSSLNANIATVNSQTGVVTGVSAGTATMRAIANDGSGVTANKSVTVINPNVKVTSISINPFGDVSVEVGKTKTLTANVIPTNATNKNVTWGSYDVNVATVNSQTGIVTGVSDGTVIIQATATDGSGVTVNKNITVTSFSQGNGTQGNPYIITTPAQLDAIRNNPSAYYKLGNNINLTSYLASGGAGYVKWGTAGWNPFKFTGNLNGAGYKITGLWIINNSSLFGIGLFSEISDGSVENLGVEIGINGIVGDVIAGGVGGLAGLLVRGTIANCYVIGNISSNRGVVGGLVGIANGSNITNCYVVGAVNSLEHSGTAGGIAAQVSQSSISNCYTTCTVTSNLNDISNNISIAGGIAATASSSTITNCYSTGTVSANNTAGGVVGSMQNETSIINCYTTSTVVSNFNAGGVVGYISGSNVINCVALNPSVNSGAAGHVLGRVVGSHINQGDGTLVNNWARSSMTTTANGTIVARFDGADCVAIPTASWWTTAAPNGPGWSSSIWHFANGQLPILQWQR